jgi:TM2 domain-containing membrane protein YozV
MRGQILVFNDQKQAGAIATADGQRYLFHINDWQDVLPPERGMAVDFTPGDGTRAHHVQLALPESMPAAEPTATPPAPRPKRKPVLTLLALFLGYFGAHRFFMGAWGWGLVQLLGVPLVLGMLLAVLPPLGGLLYFALIVFTVVESVRYVWMSDAEYDAKVHAYQAARPGPFAFFW